jgi:diacylglycerol O-acyltransferase / wax synthase
VVKAHHALGDSYALISALSGLFDRDEERRLANRAGPGTGRPRQPAVLLAIPGRAALVVRGLLGMALARLARPADLVLALAADALGRLMAARGEPTAGRTVRAMVPRTLRSSPCRTGRRARAGTSEMTADSAADGGMPGNRTAGLLLDLPVGPMPLDERVAAVRTMRHERLRRGDADAVAFVLRAINVLPSPLQRAFARTAFTGRRFNLIVSVFPGMRRACHVLGAEVRSVVPVVALADGVGLGLGAITWGRSLSIGLLADPALIPDVTWLASWVKSAFAASEPGPAA